MYFKRNGLAETRLCIRSASGLVKEKLNEEILRKAGLGVEL
jgi:hypothetical protein